MQAEAYGTPLALVPSMVTESSKQAECEAAARAEYQAYLWLDPDTQAAEWARGRILALLHDVIPTMTFAACEAYLNA